MRKGNHGATCATLECVMPQAFPITSHEVQQFILPHQLTAYLPLILLEQLIRLSAKCNHMKHRISREHIAFL